QFELVIHPDDLRPVCQLVAVQPNICTIINPLENQGINFASCRSRERSPIPPILLPELAWTSEVHAIVQILVGSIFLEDLQHCGRHVPDHIPSRNIELGLANQASVLRNMVGSTHPPAALQFHQVRSLPGCSTGDKD